jgi:hypothetical protein
MARSCEELTPMAHQAQETFVAELKGGPLLVQKGMVFADGHEVVKLDAGRGLLFKPLDLGEEQPAAPARAPRAAKAQA